MRTKVPRPGPHLPPPRWLDLSQNQLGDSTLLSLARLRAQDTRAEQEGVLLARVLLADCGIGSEEARVLTDSFFAARWVQGSGFRVMGDG